MSGHNVFILLISLISIFSCEKEHEPKRLLESRLQDTINTTAYRDSILADCAICLPYPGKEYMDLRDSDSLWSLTGRPDYGDFSIDDIYIYLVMHLDSINEKQVVETDDFWGPIEWTQSFEKGIEYRHIDYVEIGRGFDLYSRCTDKRDFLDVVSPLIYREGLGIYETPHRWNKDSTKYGPSGNTSGNCVYYIKQTEDSCYWLSWHCGC